MYGSQIRVFRFDPAHIIPLGWLCDWIGVRSHACCHLMTIALKYATAPENSYAK
jgi:hypothetical protein